MRGTSSDLDHSLISRVTEAHQLNGKDRIKVPGTFSLQSSAELFTIWVTFSLDLSRCMPYKGNRTKVSPYYINRSQMNVRPWTAFGFMSSDSWYNGIYRAFCWKYCQDILSWKYTCVHPHTYTYTYTQVHEEVYLRKTRIWELPEEACPAGITWYRVLSDRVPFGFYSWLFSDFLQSYLGVALLLSLNVDETVLVALLIM